MGTIINQENLNFLFTVVIFPLLGVFVTYAISFIQKKTKELNVKINNDEIEKYINLAEDAIVRAVVAVNQTYVESLKNQNKFDKEAQNEAFNKAKEIALSIMTDTTKAFLELAIRDFNKWIDVTIENIVSENKI